VYALDSALVRARKLAAAGKSSADVAAHDRIAGRRDDHPCRAGGTAGAGGLRRRG
jgi:hypothetical protein